MLWSYTYFKYSITSFPPKYFLLIKASLKPAVTCSFWTPLPYSRGVGGGGRPKTTRPPIESTFSSSFGIFVPVILPLLFGLDCFVPFTTGKRTAYLVYIMLTAVVHHLWLNLTVPWLFLAVSSCSFLRRWRREPQVYRPANPTSPRQEDRTIPPLGLGSHVVFWRSRTIRALPQPVDGGGVKRGESLRHEDIQKDPPTFVSVALVCRVALPVLCRVNYGGFPSWIRRRGC